MIYTLQISDQQKYNVWEYKASVEMKGKGTLMHCWIECKEVQPFWEASWPYSVK